MTHHDPLRAANLLREIFSNEKANVGFFLGAGCPVSIKIPDGDSGTKPLMPDVAGLTKIISFELAEKKAALAAKLNAYLASQQSEGSNIEVVLSKIRALMDVAGAGTVHGLSLQELTELEKFICNLIADTMSVDLPPGSNGYRDIAAWIQGFERSKAVEIFTTNYDLLIESALEESFLTYFDGFTGSRKPFFDVSAIDRDGLPSHWTKVWKLHGSINWRDAGLGCVCRYTERDLEVNSLIHPSHRKFDQSRRLPYLALLDRLKLFLKNQSSVLIVSGYSFNDDHINEVIANGLETNPTSVVIAMMFGKLEQYPVALKHAATRANLILMGNDKGVVGKRIDIWQADEKEELASLRNAFFSAPNEESWEGGNRECRLGDFKVMGELLRDVSGSFAQVERVIRA